jgi:hypothetical protein
MLILKVVGSQIIDDMAPYSLAVRTFQGPNFPDQVFFRHATFARRDTFLYAAAIFLLDPLFPWVFLAALRGQIADPKRLPRSSDRHYCGVFLGNILMLLYGRHHSRIRRSLCRFIAGDRLIQL